MTTLCLPDFDLGLIEMSAELKAARIPQPIPREECDLCRVHPRPCLVHREACDWPQVRTAPMVSP